MRELSLSAKMHRRLDEDRAVREPASLDEVVVCFAPDGGKRAKHVRDWADKCSTAPRPVKLRLDRGLDPATIVYATHQEQPYDAELERYVRIHAPELWMTYRSTITADAISCIHSGVYVERSGGSH